MTHYVCVQLSTSVPQTCEAWAVQEPLLPPLTPAEAVMVSGYIFLACGTAYAFRLLADFISKI